MKPKKRDQQLFEDSTSRFEQIQADHELFLQAFEKPTQVYRYLRARNLVSPIFLHRTLCYMKGRCTRKANTRENFKVDSLLAKRESDIKKKTLKQICKANYMNIAFIGFYDRDIDDSAVVKVETSIVRKCSTTRKHGVATAEAVSFDAVTVPCNPSTSAAQAASAVSIAGDNFRRSNGHTTSRYLLAVHVTCRHRSAEPTPAHHLNGLCNGSAAAAETVVSRSPPAKRRRCRPSLSDETTDCRDAHDQWVTREFEAELVTYDDSDRVCQLTDGYYELALRHSDHGAPSGGAANASWHGVADTCNLNGPFDALKTCPTLKFRLTWMNAPQKGIVNCDTPVVPVELCAQPSDAPYENGVLPPAVVTASPRSRRHNDRVFYQFVYKNGARQQTQSRPDCRCPWCTINCLCLFSLLRHLRYCHARFTFTYSEHPKGARVDVAINECYDGAYAGNPQDAHSHIGYAFSRSGPVRRTPVTYVILYNRRRVNLDQLDIGHDESEAAASRPIIQGHDRLYYHTLTSQPVRACEIEAASVDKNDPEWLRQKTVHLIDDFTDVNEGEKEIMKMWNLHIMHYNYIGDCSLSRACETFIRDYGERLLSDNLTRNFLLHLANLYDFGLVRPELVRRTALQLHWLQVRLRDGETDKIQTTKTEPLETAVDVVT